MNRYKAVIFDCDGTLVDSEHFHYQAWNDVLKKHGKSFSLEEYYPCVGNPTEVISERLAKKFGIGPAHEIGRDKLSRFHELQRSGMPPIRATVDFIHRLVQEKLGLKLAVASAVAREEIFAHLKNLKIDGFFDAVVSGIDDLGSYNDPEGVNKPKPYVYLETAKILGVAPSECIVIEDSHVGVTAGVKAGCFTVAVPNLFSRRQDFSKAHMKIESFGGVAAAAFLDAVSELDKPFSNPS
jgi:beta-phosphoglucomutase-like phosphatase (HAD superfamily)